MFNHKKNVNKMILLNLFLFNLLFYGCAKKPSDRIAEDEDINLFEKNVLLNDNSSPSDGRKIIFGKPVSVKNLDEKHQKLFSKTEISQSEMVSFSLSEDNLTINVHSKTEVKPLYKFPVKGYWDLANQKTPDGEKTQYLIKSDKVNLEWQKRQYVEVNPFSAEEIKVAHEQDLNLFKKALVLSDFSKKADDKLLVGSKLKVSAMDASIQALIVKSKLNQDNIVYFTLSEKKLTLYRVEGNSDAAIVIFPVSGHWDFALDTNNDGEQSQYLVKSITVHNDWQSREYLEVNPNDAIYVQKSTTLKTVESKLAEKNLYDQKCLKTSDMKNIKLKELLESNFSDVSEFCFKLNYSIVSIYKESLSENNLLLTIPVEDHIDVERVLQEDGIERSNLISISTDEKDWKNRNYIVLNFEGAQHIKNLVRPNVLTKDFFQGEFVYYNVIESAHSENSAGMFAGNTMQSMDRLRFEFNENTVTAYKVNDPLNQTGAPSPFLRFSADYFDVERIKNSVNDETNIIAESRERQWNQREFVRVNFEKNQVESYFNDVLGLLPLFGEFVSENSTVLVAEVKVDGDVLTYTTEEVVSPNFIFGNFGRGETFLEPTSIKVKHSFVKLSNRSFKAKEYTNQDEKRFGIFRTTHAGFDPKYGKTDETVENFARIYDVSGQKQIVFRLNKEFPERFKSEARSVIKVWNEALKEATGREDVLILDENSYGDFTNPLENMMVWIDERYEDQPLGYGPSFVDPNTGEVLSGKAYIYGDAVNSTVQRAIKYFDLQLGNTTESDFMVTDSMNSIKANGNSFVNPGNLASGVNSLRNETLKSEFKTLLADNSGFETMNMDETLDRLGKSEVHRFSHLASKESVNILRTGKNLTSNNKLTTKDARELFLAENQGCRFEENNFFGSIGGFINHLGTTDRQQIIKEFEERVFFTTMVHEVGHVLGLRHNFYGSIDEVNFPDEYAVEKAKEEAGLPAWKEGYRSSSVMDYTSMFEALHKSIGPYDLAAIKYVYGDKLTVQDKDEQGNLIGEKDIHKSEYMRKMEEVSAEQEGLSKDALVELTDSVVGVKKFKFCTDGQRREDPFCAIFDRGISAVEILQNLYEDYDIYYKLHAFRQGRRLFTGGSTINYYTDRAQFFFMEWIYNWIGPGKLAEGGELGSFDDLYGGFIESLNFFIRVLGTVEPGDYHYDTEKGHFVAGLSSAEGGLNMTIPAPVGRELESLITYDGLHEKVVKRGVESDKISVMMTLTQRGYPALKYYRAALALNMMDTLDLLRRFVPGLPNVVDFLSENYRGEFVAPITVVPVSENSFAPLSMFPDPSIIPDESKIDTAINSSTNVTTETWAAIALVVGHDSSGKKTLKDLIDYRVKGVNDNFPEGTETLSFVNESGTIEYVVPETISKKSLSFKLATEAAKANESLKVSRKELNALQGLPELDAAIEKLKAFYLDAAGVFYNNEIPEEILAKAEKIVDENITPEFVVTLSDEIKGWAQSMAESDNITVSRTISELDLNVRAQAMLIDTVRGKDDAIQSVQGDISGFLSTIRSNEAKMIQLKEFYDLFQ